MPPAEGRLTPSLGMPAGDTRAWQHLGRKLPLLTTALLTIAVVAIASLAYWEMRYSLVAAAGERVVAVAKQVAGALASSNDRLQRDGNALSRDSAIVAVLSRPDSGTRARARVRLAAERRATPLIASVEVENIRGERIVGAQDIASPGREGGIPSTAPVGPFLIVHDTVLTDATVPVLGTRHETIGYVRQLSRVSSAQSKQLLSGLIGADARLLIGNAGGEVWTDLDKRVAGPNVASSVQGKTRFSDGSGGKWIGAFSPVPHTPWVVSVALPEAMVLRGARVFLERLALLALLVIVAGAVGAWRLSRHILAPVTAVSKAAIGLASGDYNVRVVVQHRDELGQMASAFNQMAEAIQVSSAELENQQVELEMQQAELEEANESLRTEMEDATSARKIAERERARAAAIVAGADSAIVLVDDAGLILEFNQAGERIFAWDADSMIGQSIGRLVPAAQGGETKAELLRALELRNAAAQPTVVEVTAVRADGTEFLADLAVCRVPIDDERLYACFIRDLTERVQLQAQLQQGRKMEAIGRLAGGVAHDFNNILTVIVSYTDLVLAESQITGVARSDLEQVRTAADRAGALTRQLLAFSRKQVLHPEVLDLNMVVESVVAMLSRVLPTTIHLRKALDSDVHPIYADRGQLEQVLMNLAVNARDAMPDGGDLTIETGSALLDDAYVALHPGGKPGLHTVLSVRDTGMGMDADTRAQIFEPFFTTKALGQGTGLGLATVYGIIQQSGGSVYVYSELGKGTTFKVYFPVSGDTPSVAPALDVHLPEVGALKVLVVEDDLAVQGATCSVLTHLGHTVQCASNAAEALQIIRAAPERPDVVLTDAVMPGMNGLELAGILTAQYPLLAVIIMSGYTEEAVSGGREIPAGVGFVEKPFSAARIAKAFVDVRNGNPKRSPHHAAG